jgi:biopolymer transport protein ExbB/TolQ
MILLQAADPNIWGALAEKSITFVLLGVAIWHFYNKDKEREKTENERHKSVEDKLSKMQDAQMQERIEERAQLIKIQAEMAEIIKDNTKVMTDLKDLIENAISPNRKKAGAQKEAV